MDASSAVDLNVYVDVLDLSWTGSWDSVTSQLNPQTAIHDRDLPLTSDIYVDLRWLVIVVTILLVVAVADFLEGIAFDTGILFGVDLGISVLENADVFLMVTAGTGLIHGDIDFFLTRESSIFPSDA